jgi:FtsZ-interacting cell division protein ZipA
MDWWIWLLIILGVLVLVGIIVVGGRRAQTQRLESKREEAAELRQDAQLQARRAEERQALAEEQAERAHAERAEAEARLERADDVDPDVERERS